MKQQLLSKLTLMITFSFAATLALSDELGPKLEVMDSNRDGKTSLQEFLANKRKQGIPFSETGAINYFSRRDKNQDGYITPDEKHSDRPSISSILCNMSFPAPQPEKMTVSKVESRLIDLDGKVIEIIANDFIRCHQEKDNDYSIFCRFYYAQNLVGGLTIYFSGENARDFFLECAHNDTRTARTFFVYIKGKTPYAIGRRYRKNKNEYSW